jgi:hypothetical protein
MSPKKTNKVKPSARTEDNRPTLPPLMVEVARWLEKHDDHALGYFELSNDPPGEGHFHDQAAETKLAAHAILFARTGDGSDIVLVDRGGGLPYAVVYLDSEGGENTIATSPEQFLLLLAEAETGVSDLDDEDATEREVFAAWLAKKKVKAPEAPPFDLGAFLEGQDQTAAVPADISVAPAPKGAYDSLPPHARQLALLVGRRADDPELVTFISKELGKKVPASLSWSKDYEWVEAGKKHGIDLLFYSHLLHDAYPEIPKSKTSFIPYLSIINFRPGYRHPLPFGVAPDMDRAALEKCLGAPACTRGHLPGRPVWQRSIDAGRGLIFDVDLQEKPSPSLRVDDARALSDAAHAKPIVGLFVAWVIARNLLKIDRFTAHAALIAKVKSRATTGSAFVSAALPRGLWDRHLVDLPDLYDFTYGWFHHVGGVGYIVDDLVKVFGGREGKHGHTEPVLDEDSWDAVDKAAPVLDGVFSQWLKR